MAAITELPKKTFRLSKKALEAIDTEKKLYGYSSENKTLEAMLTRYQYMKKRIGSQDDELEKLRKELDKERSNNKFPILW